MSKSEPESMIEELIKETSKEVFSPIETTKLPKLITSIDENKRALSHYTKTQKKTALLVGNGLLVDNGYNILLSFATKEGRNDVVEPPKKTGENAEIDTTGKKSHIKEGENVEIDTTGKKPYIKEGENVEIDTTGKKPPSAMSTETSTVISAVKEASEATREKQI